MTEKELIEQPEREEKVIEIRLSDIWKFVRHQRRTLLLYASGGLVLAAIYAFLQPNEYKTRVTVMPELQAKSAGALGGLSSLAGLAGIDLGTMAGGSIDAVRPDLYPNILQSVPFALHLLNQPVYSRDFGKTMPLGAYMQEHQTQTGLGWLFGSSDDSDEEVSIYDPKNFSKAIQITKKQEREVKAVLQQVSASFDKKTGIITLEAAATDPVVAATVARLSLEYLTNYVTGYRTEKVREQASFLAQRVTEARRRYQSAEYTLESWRDRNRSLFSNVARLEEQRLQADFLLAQAVYNDLAKQLEQARVKVQEETPVFKTLEPPQVPLRKSGPKRTAMMLVGIVLGAAIGLVKAIIFRVRHSHHAKE